MGRLDCTCTPALNVAVHKLPELRDLGSLLSAFTDSADSHKTRSLPIGTYKE